MSFKIGHKCYKYNPRCVNCGTFLGKKEHVCKPVWNKDKLHPKYSGYIKIVSEIGKLRKNKPSHNSGKNKYNYKPLLKTSNTLKEKYRLGTAGCGFKSGMKLNKKDTSIEKGMEEILNKLNIRYNKQQWLLGKYCVDFYIPEKKIVVECDGEYWHNYPYGTEKDFIENCLLKANGYKVLRFWGKDITKNKDKILNEFPK